MNDYFFRFVKNVTVLVDLTEFMTKLISFEDPKLSLLAGLLGTLLIATIEFSPVYLPLGLVLYLLFNLYYKREYHPRERELSKNFRMIQRTMGECSELFETVSRFEETFLFWKDPDMSLRLIQDLIKLSLLSVPMVFFMPLKPIAIIGLWGTLLHRVSFAKHLANILQMRAKKYAIIGF